MSENILEFTKTELICLDKNTPGIDNFKNQKPEMVSHIKTRALEDQKTKLGTTWTWVYDNKIILGYISIAMFSIEKKIVFEQDRSFKSVPYGSIPALLIGQLATHENYQGKGIGEFMVLWAIDQAREYSKKIGCRLVMLHPHDDVIGWY
ncbi:MAG: GNAT family N-acetyltransferase, partial [Nitrosopumilus sp. H8]